MTSMISPGLPDSFALFENNVTANASSAARLPHGAANASSSAKLATSKDDDLAFKQNLLRYAYGYVMLLICAAGILGNVLAFAVLSRKSMRSSTTATYLRCMAAVDACVLILAIFRYRSYYILLSEAEVMHVIMFFDPVVQVYVVPFFWICLGVSSYITLSLSLERYLVIRWPFTLKKTFRVGTVRVCTVVAILGVFLVTLPNFLCYNILITSFHGLQVAAVVVSDDYLDARSYVHVYNHYLIPIMWYMGPWVVVAVVNILLSLQVQKSSRIRVGVPNSLNPNRNLSVLIILIVGVYMVCHFPRCILALYCLVNHRPTNDDRDDFSHVRAYHIVRAIAEILNIFNSCLNIVVYCVTGARFRREAKKLLLCRSCCRNTVSPPTHQSVHVSLREVPATPVNTRKSFNMSHKELQLTRSNLLHSPYGSQAELQPIRSVTSNKLQQSSSVSLSYCSASPASSASSTRHFKDWSPEGVDLDRKCTLQHVQSANAGTSSADTTSGSPERGEQIFTVLASSSPPTIRIINSIEVSGVGGI